MPQSLGGVQITVDLSTRDFEGYRRDALALAPSLTPYWTDFSAFEPAVVLVELFAYMADNLSYYVDRAANEAFLPTAQQRRSVVNLCALLNYTLGLPVAAVVDLTVTCTGAGTIPVGSTFKTAPEAGSPSLVFTSYVEVVSSGAGTYTVPAAHFQLQVDEVLGSSDGLASQTFDLTQSPLVYHPSSGDPYIELYVDEGVGPVLWTLVDNFVDSEPTDTHYTLFVDEDDVCTITFGDGVNGKIPAAGTDNVTATYAYGGGVDGNAVGTTKIVVLGDTPAFVSAVTNAAQPSGGDAKESIEEAKANAPLSFRAMDRCVTLEDYAAKAKDVGGVNRALAYNGPSPYEVYVVVAVTGANPVPTGAWDPYTATGSGVLGAVGAYLEARKTAPVKLYVDGPTPVYVRYEIQVVCKPTHFQAKCEEAVQAAIDDFLDVESRDLGDRAALSDLYAAITAVTSVKSVDVLLFSRQPYCEALVAIGAVDVDAFDFGTDPPSIQSDQIFELVFTSSTTYAVTGSIAGYLGTGTLDVEFAVSDDYTWTLTAGSPAPAPGDRFRLRVGGKVDNIEVGDLELLLPHTDATLTVLTVTGGIE